MKRAPMRRIELTALTAVSAMALAACAGFPSKETPAGIKPAEQYATGRSFAAPAKSWPTDAWWEGYGDPQLGVLIGEALAGSPSIADAEARLRRAQAIVEVSGAATVPQVGANAQVTQQKMSYNYITPKAVTPQGLNDYGLATLNFSWELDFWGKNRAALAAATSDADAAAAEAAQARLALAAAIASAYAELAREHAALDTAQAALEVRAQTADLFRRRYENGLETLGGVRQVESRRAAAEADVLSIKEQLGLQRNRIAALMGAGPDRGLAIARPTVDLAQSFGLPKRLAAELLGRRPDVVAARLRAEAAAKRIDQARAAFYPNVNLAGFIGVQSLGLDRLAKSGSSTSSAGPAISLPIFDGGALRGQLKSAQADYAQAVANYDRTLVQALQDVADAAVSQKALGGQLERTGEAVDAAREAWRIQNDRYQGGLSSYLDVLSTEDTLLSSLRTLTDLQSRSFTLDVALVKALGGGYQTQHD